MNSSNEKSNSAKNIIVRTIIIISFVIMLILAFFNNRLVRKNQWSIKFMGTETNIIVIAKTEKNAAAAIAAAEEQLMIVEAMMSYHNPNSQLSQLNNTAFKRPFKPDKMIFDVIKQSLFYSKISDGQFDVTIGALVDLWQNAKTMPSEIEIQQAKDKVGYQKLIIDDVNQTIKFTVEGMKIDLGAIAKGYGIDRASDAMKAAGAVGGLVDVGGDIYCFGKTDNDKKTFTVGLQNPQNVADTNAPLLLTAFELCDCAVATSGDYQRFVEIQGQKMSHIISPSSKKSAKIYSSVSVIAPNAAQADALATTLSLLEPDSALKVIESIPDAEALMILSKPNASWIKSAKIDKYLK